MWKESLNSDIKVGILNLLCESWSRKQKENKMNIKIKYRFLALIDFHTFHFIFYDADYTAAWNLQSY